MKKIIYILIFSLVSGVVFMFVMFLAAKLLYNINNSISFYCIDILSFFKSMNKKEVGFIILISSINFVITYLRYRDY
jgi:hypothetical protein